MSSEFHGGIPPWYEPTWHLLAVTGAPWRLLARARMRPTALSLVERHAYLPRFRRVNGVVLLDGAIEATLDG